ncbi:transcriptional repressor LexA [Candidatus Magnetominusculus dajiuhuensis]|uniref:transcriptional repressor LexA n=1 Tax=Candidatus Magnetominusculus dajiuhuensis TaxID=3137712 RepID=UPI003B43AB4A
MKRTDKQTKMTAKQSKVLEFIKDHLSQKGYPPTIREICKGFGFSSPLSAKQHVDALIRKGYLKKDDAKQRALEVTGMIRPSNTVRVPLVRRVRAAIALEDIQDYITLDKGFWKIESGFALAVSGQDMPEAGIRDGDIVFVDSGHTVRDNDIAVVVVGDEAAAIKRIYYEGDHIRLVPENKDMHPVLASTPDVRVLGRVIGMMRRFSGCC